MIGRSREGAWIEMSPHDNALACTTRRSREGAWIEMGLTGRMIRLINGRSREGAWIENVLGRSNSAGR